jgi:glycosyltransferase involved in cell wall biosynthesis
VGSYTLDLIRAIGTYSDTDVSIITGHEADGSSKAGCKIYPVVKTWNLYDLTRIVKIASELDPDIVHIQYPSRGYKRTILPSFLPIIFNLLGKPVVQTWHEPLSKKGWIRYIPNMASRSALIFVEPDYVQTLPWFYRSIIRLYRRYCIPVGSTIPAARLNELQRNRLRERYDSVGKNLIAFFGFADVGKGVELLFRTANPEADRIVLIGGTDVSEASKSPLARYLHQSQWKGKSFLTGFVQEDLAAEILASADVIVFPFREGVSKRNTSYLAGLQQDTMILTTSNTLRYYDERQAVFFARPGNAVEMRKAVREWMGRRSESRGSTTNSWDAIAKQHIKVYQDILHR